MSELNRFDLVMCGHSREIEECDNGDYMPYEDHEAIVAKLTEDIKVLRSQLAEADSWLKIDQDYYDSPLMFRINKVLSETEPVEG